MKVYLCRILLLLCERIRLLCIGYIGTFWFGLGFVQPILYCIGGSVQLVIVRYG